MKRFVTQLLAGLIGCLIALGISLFVGLWVRWLRAPLFVVISSVYLVLTYLAASRLDRRDVPRGTRTR